MQVFSHDQVLSRISQFYHDDYRQLANTVLQSDETIIWAGNQSCGLDLGGATGDIGYFLITSYRAIRVDFSAELGFLRGRERIYYDKKYFAVGIPSYPLTAKEMRSRQVSETLFRTIVRIERKDYPAKSDKRIVFVQVFVGLAPRGGLGFMPMLFYNLEEGQEAYDILQCAVREATSNTKTSLIDKLERLAALHRNADLTDDEFEKAKQQLLNA